MLFPTLHPPPPPPQTVKSFSITGTRHIMLFREIICFYFETRAKLKAAVRGQTAAQFLDVTASGTCYWALNDMLQKFCGISYGKCNIRSLEFIKKPHLSLLAFVFLSQKFLPNRLSLQYVTIPLLRSLYGSYLVNQQRQVDL
jgi:hypothetical protein